jgi:hypothetical protein
MIEFQPEIFLRILGLIGGILGLLLVLAIAFVGSWTATERILRKSGMEYGKAESIGKFVGFVAFVLTFGLTLSTKINIGPIDWNPGLEDSENEQRCLED